MQLVAVIISEKSDPLHESLSGQTVLVVSRFSVTWASVDVADSDGFHCPHIVINCDIIHLSKTYECCVAVECGITAVGTAHASIVMSVNYPVSTFLV